MKFPYTVTHNGITYKPGTEIPDNEESAKVEETVVDEVIENKAPIEEKKFEHTKTEINRMPIDELKSLAKESGVENANEKSGADLKKELIEKFGL